LTFPVRKDFLRPHPVRAAPAARATAESAMFSRKLDAPIRPQPDLAHSLPFIGAATDKGERISWKK
jgi:hypothetical protein